MNRRHTEGPWGPMNDGPAERGLWEPWTAFMEAAPGLTIGSRHNTEPICRVSGYCQPVLGNARLIAAAPDLLEALKKIATPLYIAPELSTAGKYADTRAGLRDCKEIARAAIQKLEAS